MTTLDLSPVAVDHAAFPSLLSQTRTRFVVEMRNFLRSKEAWIWIMLYPTFMFVIFDFVMGNMVEIENVTASFGQVFLPGMLATGLLNASFQTVASDVVVERVYGTLRRLAVTPLSPVAYMLGKIGMVIATAIVQTAILLGVAVAFFNVTLTHITTGEWIRFAWLFLLSLAVGTVAGIAFASLMRSAKAGAAFIPAIALVLQFLSGVFFLPFSGMPAVGQHIANVFPLRWMALGMRSVFYPDQFVVNETGESWQTGLTAIILIAWFVVALAVTAKTFKWRSKADG